MFVRIYEITPNKAIILEIVGDKGVRINFLAPMGICSVFRRGTAALKFVPSACFTSLSEADASCHDDVDVKLHATNVNPPSSCLLHPPFPS